MRIARARLGWIATLATLLFLGSPGSAEARLYRIDPQHTTVLFRVRHLFTTVTGRFRTFEGTISFDPQHPQATRVEGTIDAASLDTNVAKRDKHLRSPAFFYVEKYPKITFKSTKVTDIDRKHLRGKLHGILTIRGVSKPIVLDVQFLGEGQDPWGNTRAGFHAETTIDRKDFGLTWNEALETGGFLVGDEVKIEIDAEALPEEAES